MFQAKSVCLFKGLSQVPHANYEKKDEHEEGGSRRGSKWQPVEHVKLGQLQTVR